MKTRIYIGLMLLVVASFLLAKLVLDKPQAQNILRVDCADIGESCGNDLFTVRFLQKPQVMKPMGLKLHLNQSKNVRDVHASFAMQGMEMGLNRYRLIPADGDWQGEVTLPVCAQGRSDWNMLLEIELEGGVQRFLLPFTASRN